MSIEASVVALEKLCREGDATALQAALFTHDATIGGEGAPSIVSGQSALLQALTEMLQMTPQLSIQLRKAIPLTEDTTLTWLEWTSPLADQEQNVTFRSMTVWKRDESSWKIVGDMYAMGAFA